jgi:hypothetical protein
MDRIHIQTKINPIPPSAAEKAGEKLWYSNYGVLDEVVAPNLQPSMSFKVSTALLPIEQHLYVRHMMVNIDT